MVKSFKDLMRKYFPRGGAVDKLKVSRAYMDLVNEEVVPPSRNLLFRLEQAYNIPLKEFMLDGLVVYSDYSVLLNTAETLSYDEKFVNDLSGVVRNGKVSSDGLLEVVVENYSKIHVPGRLSTIFTNVSNFFIAASTDSRLDVPSELEFNYFTRLRDPFVKLHHKSINSSSFMFHERKGNFREYVVFDSFLPLTVEKISTDSNNWRKRFIDDVPRGLSYGDWSNKVFVKYKKPISADILDSLRNDVDKNFNNPDFFGLHKKGGKVLFTERVAYSKLDSGGNKSLEVSSAPAMSLEDDYTMGFHFYPIQLLNQAMKSGGGDNYWPMPGTLRLANRFQNYVDGRIKK